MMGAEYQALMRPRPRAQAWLWLFAIGVAASTAWVADKALQAAEDARRSEEILAKARLQQRSIPPPKPSREEIERAKRWDALAAERSYSWYPLFRALEQANNQDIELLEFIPDKVGAKLILRGEARSVEALSAYLTSLAEQKGLNGVYLAHQKNVMRSGLVVLAFEVRTDVAP